MQLLKMIKEIINERKHESLTAYPNQHSMQIYYESICRHIYAHPQGKIKMKLIKLLVLHKSRRRKQKPKGKRQCILDRESIDNRPRKVLGYYTPMEMFYFEKQRSIENDATYEKNIANFDIKHENAEFCNSLNISYNFQR